MLESSNTFQPREYEGGGGGQTLLPIAKSV